MLYQLSYEALLEALVKSELSLYLLYEESEMMWMWYKSYVKGFSGLSLQLL